MATTTTTRRAKNAMRVHCNAKQQMGENSQKAKIKLQLPNRQPPPKVKNKTGHGTLNSLGWKTTDPARTRARAIRFRVVCGTLRSSPAIQVLHNP